MTKIYDRKLQNLIPTIHETSNIDHNSHDLNKGIYKFSNYHLTDSDKSLLIRGLNFAIPPKKTEYPKFLLPFEFLFCNIKSNSESSIDLASIKACLQDAAFPSYSTFNKDNSLPFNLSKDEFESLCKLINNFIHNFVIQKGGKRNTMVILNKDSYFKSVETLLEDSSKFKSIPVAPDRDLNYVINSEKRVTDLLKKLNNKNAISEEFYNKLRPVGSKLGALYGSAEKWITIIQTHSFSNWYP